MANRRLLVGLACALLVSAALSPAPVLAGSSDLLPDLQMAPLFGVELRTAVSGHKHLRFGTIVYNDGDGPLEVRAKDTNGGAMNRVVQAIKQTDDSWRKVLTNARVFYAGDGHDHWHVARFNRATLTALPGTPETELRLRKIGFCLVDSLTMPEPPPGSPGFRTYMSCGVKASTSVKMGISQGWGDIYAPETKFQEIDVTGLPAGDYRLCTTTNPRAIWKEKGDNTANNSSWVDLELDVASNDLIVTGTGETPC